MLKKLKEDQAWTGAVLLIYMIPFFVWMALSRDVSAPSNSWPFYGAGLLMVLTGALTLILMHRRQEVQEPSKIIEAPEPLATPTIPQEAVDLKPNPEIETLRGQLQEQTQELQKCQDENVSLKNQNFQVIHAYNTLKTDMEAFASRQGDAQNATFQQNQERIFELENQVEDLKYELRSILNLNTADLAGLPEEESFKL